MTTRTDVIFADTRQGIDRAVEELFRHFGGVRSLLKSSGDAYLKVNGVDHKPYAYTDPEVLRATITHLKQQGARRIHVIENCTQGNLTRLVFKVTGMARVCRQTGAIPVYLDETDAVPVFLEGLKSFVDISAFVHEHLVENADKNLYISLPKLKTHSMSQVTLSVKNQFGLIHQASRIADHNFNLHRKFADIYRLLRPDFVIVDGLIASNHGHYIAEKLADDCIVPINCLIGGDNPLAVDTIAAEFLGYARADVPHLELAARTGIGAVERAAIEIVNADLFKDRRQALTHQLLDRFPPELTILRGRTRCCPEGCRRNTETVVEVFHNDHNGRGNFTILMGKDIDPDAVAAVRPPVHLAGSCAISDYGPQLVRRFGKKQVTFSHGCNNLAETAYALCRLMKVKPLDLAGTNPAAALAELIKARIHRTRAIIPPLL